MVRTYGMKASGTRCRSFSAAVLAASEVSAASDTSCARAADKSACTGKPDAAGLIN